MSVITVDTIRSLLTSTTSNRNSITNLKSNINTIMTTKADKYWHTAWHGVNYLNTGSTFTLNLTSGKTLSDVTEIRFIFSWYDTDGGNAVDAGGFQYTMTNSNDSGIYDGFYDTNYIVIPSKASESGEDWQSFFFTKSFNLDAPNKVIGKGTTQINDDKFACVLRTVLVKY